MDARLHRRIGGAAGSPAIALGLGVDVKNQLSDLNNHLFCQLERLSDESITGDALAQEIQRSNAVGRISKEIISAHQLVLDAKVAIAEYQLKDADKQLGLGHDG
jgi:hypothetical protein